jgi:superfamily I DNA/RNA helicase
VFGAIDGVIPLGSELDAQTVSSEAAVLYVGMTRARDLLSFALGHRWTWKVPVTLVIYRLDCQMVRLRRIQALAPNHFAASALQFDFGARPSFGRTGLL